MNSQSTTILPPATTLVRADKYLNGSMAAWFVVAVIGQLLFAAYVAGFYGGTALSGDIARWNDELQHGYREGETMSNLAVGIHLLFAALITLMGPLQLIPFVRRRFPMFHRWNGRMYVMLTAVGGLTGLYMIWAHEEAGGAVSRTAMTLEAVLILLAGVLVWRFAVGRKMRQHEHWAVRLFLVASGVWFFRVMLMGWLVVLGPVGIDPETFTGPLLDVLGYAHYLLPLAIYELYLWAKQRSSAPGRYAMTGLMIVCTLLTAIGVFGATMGMWLPAFTG